MPGPFIVNQRIRKNHFSRQRSGRVSMVLDGPNAIIRILMMRDSLLIDIRIRNIIMLYLGTGAQPCQVFYGAT